MKSFIANKSNIRGVLDLVFNLVTGLVSSDKQIKISIDEHKESRKSEHNAMMWAVLTRLANKVKWPVLDAYGDVVEQFITPEDWKNVLTASLIADKRCAAGVDGGWVLLGESTRKKSKEEIMQIIELAYAVAGSKGVSLGE